MLLMILVPGNWFAGSILSEFTPGTFQLHCLKRMCVWRGGSKKRIRKMLLDKCQKVCLYIIYVWCMLMSDVKRSQQSQFIKHKGIKIIFRYMYLCKNSVYQILITRTEIYYQLFTLKKHTVVLNCFATTKALV